VVEGASFNKQTRAFFIPCSLRLVAERAVPAHCAACGALMLPAHVGAPFAGRIEATEHGFRPLFSL
jgi:hypothetical protein